MTKPCFLDCLNYLTPARGGWSIVRTSLLVPESHQLFVGASACMRHIVLSSIELGLADRISCLNLYETDIISGSYEDLILAGADELLESLDPKPRVLMIYLTCMDDLLATDTQSFLEPLNLKYKRTRSIICRMNPIMVDSALPPGISVQAKMYELLEPSERHDRGINFIGNNIAVHPDNELVRFLQQQGFSLRHLSMYQRFDDFQDMAKSCLNLVMTPAAVYAAEEMKSRLNIDYCTLYPDYDFGRIKDKYAEIFSALNLVCPDYSAEIGHARRALTETAKHLNGRRISIDHEATYRPFGMARMLHQHGFRIKTIHVSEVAAYEAEDARWAVSQHLEISQPELYRKATVGTCEKKSGDTVCIGFEAAYQENSPYVLTLAADGDLLGFQGVAQLCRRLSEAAEYRHDLKKLIDESVLVV